MVPYNVLFGTTSEGEAMLRVAINGFGRIGRQALRLVCSDRSDDRSYDFEVVGINDLTDTQTLAYLMRHDTVHRALGFSVQAEDHALRVGGRGSLRVGWWRIPVFAERDPAALPWKDLDVDIVLECTGFFAKDGAARAHVVAGAKRVIVAEPTSGDDTIKSFVFGVNHRDYAGEDVIDTASCTTNCAAPVMLVLSRMFGVNAAMLSTTHSVTAGQNLVDGIPPGRKANNLRLGRAAGQNMVPTTTGAARAVARVLPQLGGLFDGLSVRVPTLDVSLVDITVALEARDLHTVTKDEVNAVFREAAQDPAYCGVLGVTDEPLVSSDFIGDPHAAIVDLSLTAVVNGLGRVNLVKVVAWYDNEGGYTHQMLRMARVVGKTIQR
ncbi:MAG: type I glyceraldehyde-3-phosphate dehydrogenase [Candidatus Uhrbacteria bacterium]